MREIKFRGWHFSRFEGDKPFMGKIMDWRINADGCMTWNCVEPGNEKGWQPLITNHPKYTSGVVMQFTGLMDKNGKEIYEGDILHSETHILYEIDDFGNEHSREVKAMDSIVQFRNGKFESAVIGKAEFQFIDCSIFNALEVIGNIHENTELLKEAGVNASPS